MGDDQAVGIGTAVLKDAALEIRRVMTNHKTRLCHGADDVFRKITGDQIGAGMTTPESHRPFMLFSRHIGKNDYAGRPQYRRALRHEMIKHRGRQIFEQAGTDDHVLRGRFERPDITPDIAFGDPVAGTFLDTGRHHILTEIKPGDGTGKGGLQLLCEQAGANADIGNAWIVQTMQERDRGGGNPVCRAIVVIGDLFFIDRRPAGEHSPRRPALVLISKLRKHRES